MPDSHASTSACPECGAHRAPGQSRCDLCGYSPDEAVAPPVDAPATAPAGVFCNACGWRNPAGARYCSQCGAALEGSTRPEAAQPGSPLAAPGARVESSAPLGRTLGIVLGAAVLLVVALFVITVMSKKAVPATTAADAPVPTELPTGDALFAQLSADQERTVATLEGNINAAEGEERLSKQREMVNLLIGFGRPDLAAQAQEDLARMEGTAPAWTKAGDLYFQWMMMLEDGKGNPQPVALRALAAYEESVALQPDDLDVRARLAWAAQYDAQQPMRAIEETKAVLLQDSTHIGALQNYAIFLARIGRTDQAVAQMERVKRMAGADSVLIRNANAFIEAVRDRPSGER